MTFEENYHTLNSCFRKKIGSKQLRTECKLKAKENTTIAKILCVNAESINKEADFNNNELKTMGEVIFKVVYSGEDGQLYSIDETVLTEAILNSEVKEGFPLIKSEVVDLNLLSVKPDSVTMSAVVDVDADAIVNDEVKCLIQAPENVVAKFSALNYCTSVSKGMESYEISEEFEIKENIKKLLMTNVNMCVKECYAGTGYIVVKGECNVNMTYQVGEEESEFKSILKTFGFKQEIEAEGTTPESILNTTNSINYNKLKIAANNIDGNTIVKVDIPIKCVYSAMKKEVKDVVEDAFSTVNKLNISVESFEKCKCSNFKHDKQSISTTVEIEDENYEIETIAGDCGGNAYVAKSYATDGYVVVEGVSELNVVYYYLNEEKLPMYESMKVEVPYSFEIECAEATSKGKVMAYVSVKECGLRAKRGKQLDVEMDMCTYFNVWETEQDSVVSNMEMAEEYDKEENSLKMYVVKKDSTLWDVCKYVCADPEMIMEQNKDLEFPLKKDAMIIIYKPKQEMY